MPEPGFKGRVPVEEHVQSIFDYVVVRDLGVHLFAGESEIVLQFLVRSVEDPGVYFDVVKAVYLKHWPFGRPS